MTTTKRSEQEARRLIGGRMLENGCDVEAVKSITRPRPPSDRQDGLSMEKHPQNRRIRRAPPKKRFRQTIQTRRRSTRTTPNDPSRRNEQWTSKRVARVISEQFHVEYNSNYLCELISSLGFSQQMPQIHSVKRDQAAIDHWKRYVWPVIKKNR